MSQVRRQDGGENRLNAQPTTTTTIIIIISIIIDILEWPKQ